MAEWTVELVAAQFEAAAQTAQRLPVVTVQGHRSLWPQIVLESWEQLNREAPRFQRPQPSPADVEHMLTTMRWVQWLDVEDRHLIWKRAGGLGWPAIARERGCHRTTAWRQWLRALGCITEQLNRARIGPPAARAPTLSVWRMS